jgi:hypothetical protein
LLPKLSARLPSLLSDSFKQYNDAMSTLSASLPSNPFVRLTRRDATASQVLSKVQSVLDAVVQITYTLQNPDYDYTQIDPELTLIKTTSGEPIAPPTPGVGYAGLTPDQRAHFLQWLDEPTTLAPLAFQQLYLAHLEVHLVEEKLPRPAILSELQRLQAAPAWQANPPLARTTLLACWLLQDGRALAHWTLATPLPEPLLGIAFGHQALLHEEWQPAQVIRALQRWQGRPCSLTTDVLALRLRSLHSHLDADPLAHALANLDKSARQPRPWRCQHRDLRLALPQPDLRPLLEPLLAELTTASSESPPLRPATPPSGQAEPVGPAAKSIGWHLILEFGQSRSDLFHFALTLAQRLPTFTQIMDEKRNLIYRVQFKKSDMRQFWRLWDYVQSWSTTQVYLNGVEIEKWKVYPYSEYLQ